MKSALGAFVVVSSVVGALLMASPAAAQAWIGQIAGEMAAQRAAAAQEAACLAGTPPDPRKTPKIMAKLDALMAGYFALSSKSENAALRKVFSLTSEGVSFRDSTGTDRKSVV